MKRRIVIPALLLVSLTAIRCTVGVAIPEGKLKNIAQGTLEIGHPMVGPTTGARVVGGSPGGCGGGTRYVDVEIGYKGALSGKQYYMTVRYDVISIDPCEVNTDVIADTGPMPPVLLDNALMSTEVGRWVCEELR
jgi:hypothetical protein